MDPNKARFAQDTTARTLAEVIAGADVFLGLSAGGVLKPEMVATMAPKPIILALANPSPRSCPRTCRPCATTRSSRPGARTIRTRSTTSCASRTSSAARSTAAPPRSTSAMKLAAVHAIAELAQAEQCEVVAAAYGQDRELRRRVPDPEAVRSAPDDEDRAGRGQGGDGTGVATRPIADMDAYARSCRLRLRLRHHHEADLRAAKQAAAAHRLRRGRGRARPARRAGGRRRELARPMLIGRPAVHRAAHREVRPAPAAGARLRRRQPRGRRALPRLLADLPPLTERKGVTAQLAKIEMRRRLTLIGAMMLHKGEVDGMICGTCGLARHCTCTTSTR